ncbi:hypothetical protein MTR67_008452 [Solanum verrucosum]|uniref:eIF3 subunit M C-terminal helix domain-containing protein n=1 Tax=Solanum verrucosum TaxID=315347 RepID=A0AAF0TCG2_SOLVR|nr:hypothetical protein MTR67_008452 [Solanum verrucosum]
MEIDIEHRKERNVQTLFAGERDPRISSEKEIAEVRRRREAVAERQVNGLCAETNKWIIEGRWPDLSTLMLSSADLIFSKASKKGGLFLKNSNILKESKGSAKTSFKFLIKYLETFSDEDVSAMNEAKEEAVHAIIAFVKAPYIFQCGLLDMSAIVQLEKHVIYALAYQLLKIFLTSRLDDYMNFHEANSELLKTYAGLLHEDCVEKMRLLTLVDLGMTKTGQIPYSMIKDTLKIDDIEVRCTERVFGTSQWQLLRAKLMTWRGNIAGVISTIHANKVVEDITQTMQGLAIH